MRSLALKLLALLAYMAMPFTMSVAMSAPAQAAPHHETVMPMEGMEHCPGQTAPDIDHTAFIGCAMMCAALPAAATREQGTILLVGAPLLPARVRAYSGIDLEIATPPPRTA